MANANEIENVSLASLRRYLLARGWRRTPLKNALDLFSIGPDANPIEIALPQRNSDPFFSARIRDALFTLSGFERRSIGDVATSVNAINVDAIRTKLPENVVRKGTIPLRLAETCIRQIRRILTASAHTELHESLFFDQPDMVAEKYAASCRFGHTFRGSFGLIVESPVGPQTLEQAVPMEQIPAPPFERMAVLRLARGLRFAGEAIANRDTSHILNNTDSGLNANGFQALVDMLEANDAKPISFEVALSVEWGAPKDVAAVSGYRFSGPDAIAVLRSAVAELKSSASVGETTIFGTVTTLHSTENPSDLFSRGTRDVMIEWISDDFGRRNVRVPLSPEAYLVALDAHRNGSRVMISGKLNRGRKGGWRLEEAGKLVII